jgi:alcohol dehydrogenase
VNTALLASLAPFTLGRLPRIEFGAGRFADVPEVVSRHGRRMLLVTGTRSFRSSARYWQLLADLDGAGVELVGEVAVRGEPSPSEIDDAVGQHQRASVEVVLGIGGGSALDAAKAIAGLLRTRTRVRDHLEGLGATLPYPGPAIPFVAVPTTAGTGSEATRNAVVTERGPEGFKRSFRDERLVAAVAVVDPDLLAGAPPDLIASNGMDAVTQLLEALVSSRAGPLTDTLALAGLAAARDGLAAWHADPEGEGAPAARSSTAYAALLSGICLANAGLGAVHGLASPLGALFPIPHGAACGALLPAAVEANIAALEARAPDSPALVKYAQVARLLDASDRPLAGTLRNWQRGLGIRPLGEFGVADRDIPRIVADSRGSSMSTNPVSLTSEEIASILRASL